MYKKRQRLLSLGLSALLVLGCLMVPGVEVQADDSGGTTYYIDLDGGDDENTGISEKGAWSSLEKVNSTTFQPGDKILFQKGDVWTGQLSPKGSGEKGNPIEIGAYGDSEARPLIQGNNWCGENGDDLENRIFNAAVYFYNQQYWEITSLEVTNRIPGDNPDDHIKKYGILIMAEDAGTLEQMNCRNLYVHDIVSHPIGQQAGIGRGGIIYSIRGNQVPTKWNDITVENNIVGPNINHYGINFMSTWGSSRFQHETGIPNSEYAGSRYNSTNLVIRNNYCEDIGNAAICPTAYSNAVIEYNISDSCNSGPNGNVPIWWENGEYTVAQFNEVFGSGASDSKEDSQAFDADVNATLNYIQYNYTHDNPSGAYFECALGSTYTTHIRYNISQNDGYGTNSYGGGAVVTIGGSSSADKNKMYVYNNDFYLSEGHNSYITNNWDGITVNKENFRFTNNVIYSDASSKGWHKDLMGTVENNAYGGSDTSILRSDDEKAVMVTSEDFKEIGSAGRGLDSAAGYQLSENSKCKEAGMLIADNGGRDYWGNPVSALSAPNIGFDNSGTANQIPKGTIDFEDRPQEEASFTGKYKNCTFSEEWRTGAATSSKALYLAEGQTTGVITLPNKQKLKSFQAQCKGTAWVTLEAAGYKKSFLITSANNYFNTGLTSAVDNLTVTVNGTAEGSVYFDNLLLEKGEYEPVNLALNKPVETSGKDQNPGSYGNDGNDQTLWIHAGDELNEWWTVDLQQEYDLDNFELVFEQEETGGAWGYQIEGKKGPDDEFEMLYDRADNTDGSRVHTGNFQTDGTYRYLKVILTKFPGYDYWPGFAEFRVFEKQAEEIEPDGITLSQSEALLTSADVTLQLMAEVTPEDADNIEILWESSDEHTALVNQEGLVTPVANGTSIITATVKGTDIKASCLVTVSIPVPPVGITLNQTEALLTSANETLQLMAEVTPENADNTKVLWKSSDERAARVDQEGMVTAIGNGTSIITATVDGTDLTAVCEVTVQIPNPVIPVSKVELDRGAVTLIRSGETVQVKAIVSPPNATDQTVSFHSTDTRVAGVDSAGVIRAIGNGTTDIIATTRNGNKTAVCKVNVAIPVKVTGINLDKSDVKITNKGGTVQLNAQVLPANASNKALSWTSSQPTIASVSSTGKVTALKNGKTVISVKTSDGGFEKKCTVTVEYRDPQVEKPGKITNVKTSRISNKSMTISWKKDKSADYYKVFSYNKKDKSWNEIKKTESTSVKLSGLKEGTSYTYRVAGINAGGTGKNSASCTAITKPGSTKLKTVKKSTSGRAVLSYTKVKNTRYVVSMKTGKGAYKNIGDTSKTKLQSAKLKKGKTYTFRIRTYVKHGKVKTWGNYSNTVKYKAR